MKRLFYLFLISALVISSCDKNGLEQEAVSKGISVSSDNVYIYPGGGSEQILFTCGTSWTLTSNAGWLHVLGENGSNLSSGKAGSYLLTLKADVNMDMDDRSTTLVFTSNEGKQTVVVNQDMPYLDVALESSLLSTVYNKTFYWYESADRDEDVLHFSIQSNTWWKISGSDPKYALSQTEGEGDAVVSIIPTDINISEDDYYMSLLLEGPDVRKKYELNFVQGHLIFKLLNNLSETCNELGAEIKGLVVESEVDWHLKESTGGWSVKGNTSGKGNVGNPIRTSLGDITIAPNESRSHTVHKFEFIPEDPTAQSKNVSIVYEITQDPFVFNVDGNTSALKSFRSPDAASAAITYTVNSSADWYVDTKPEWIQVLEGTSFGVGAVGGASSAFTFAPAAQNLELSTRSGSVVIKNSMNNMTLPVDVNQNKFLFSAESNLTSNLEAVPENDVERWINMTTSGAWYIDSHPDWIDFLSEKTGSYVSEDPFQIYFKANSTNSAEEDREGDIVFVSQAHKNTSNPLTKIVHVIQNGFKFFLGESEGTEDDILDEFSELGNRTQTINVYSPTAWTSSVSKSWVHLSPSTGSASAEVVVSVDMNATKSPRSATISFKNPDMNGGKGKTLTVSIAQAAYQFSVDYGATSSITVDPILDQASSTRSVNVVSSGKWSATSDYPWVTLSKTGGDGNDSFTINIENNNTSSQRIATVTVTNSDLSTGNKSSLLIIQKPFEFSAKASATMNFNALSENQSFKITYKCSDVVIANGPDWCTLTDDGDGTITVKAENNLSDSKRSDVIEISNNYTEDVLKFTVSQEAYKFSHNGNASYSLNAKDNKNITISLVSTGKWSASTDVSWLKVTPASGTGDATLTISSEDNTATESRKAALTITCEDNKARTHTITFTQEAAPKK